MAAPGGACKRFRRRRKPWRKAEFTSAAHNKGAGSPRGESPWGGCDIDKPRNLAKSVTVE